MLKKLRMGQILDSLWILLFLLAVGGALLFHAASGLVWLVKGPAALTGEMQLEDMAGEYVSWTVYYPVEEYMETTQTTKVNGVSAWTRKNRSSWLVIDEERAVCLSVEVPEKRLEDMDGQADLFYQAMEQETEMPEKGVAIAGTLETLEGEELEYFKQAADDAGLPAGDVVYHIGDGVIKGETKTNILGFAVLGAFFFLLFILILVKTLKKSAKELLEQYIEKNPKVTMEQLESDFNGAEEVSKVWIGRKWTFSPKLQELLFDNRQVVWVHSGSVRSGKSINFFVWWHMIDGSEKQVSLSSKKKCNGVMEKYNQFPHIVTGNNPEYGYMLRNDREAFLDIKYRKNILAE